MHPGMAFSIRKCAVKAAGTAVACLLVLGLGWGCASVPSRSEVYDYFTQPAQDDPWSRKIARWQDRERFEQRDSHSSVVEEKLRAPAAVAEPGETGTDGAGEELQVKYAAFRAEQRRVLALETARWIQSQARQHYLPDGPIDHWATLAETLEQNGDDCDGLELLTYNLLRDLGFDADEVYRAIVYRPSDGQHHMVTFWFEDRDDPWVIDPTGAMTHGMPRMSELPEWRPLKVFGLDRDYSVERRAFAARS